MKLTSLSSMSDVVVEKQKTWPAAAYVLPVATKATIWVWRTLCAATEELQGLVDGVIDDLEAIGETACSAGILSGGRKPGPSTRASRCGCRGGAGGGGAACDGRLAAESAAAVAEDEDDPSIRVPPPPPREDLLFGSSDEVANDRTPTLLPDGARSASLRRVPNKDFEQSPTLTEDADLEDFEIINFGDVVVWDDDDDEP